MLNKQESNFKENTIYSYLYFQSNKNEISVSKSTQL